MSNNVWLQRSTTVTSSSWTTFRLIAGVTDAIEAIGATAFYLPPYSPDLNPIEQVFSKLKALLRKAAERTVPKLWRRIRALLRTISDEECLNFFRHAGYISESALDCGCGPGQYPRGIRRKAPPKLLA
jgi:transposase